MASGVLSRLFALTIGIDEYLDEGTNNLKGAVADADRFVQHLTGRLGVPSERIRSLRDKKATRNAIKKELVSLAHNSRIKRNDPIVIYFAGHGNETPSPPEWKNWDKTVQTLVPHDYGEPDGKGGTIQGLPDRSLGTILKNLADAKGNNITVILDCCHSGSGTRSKGLVRGTSTVGKPIPPDLDEDLFPSVRGAVTLPKFRHHGLESHVLLAACTPDELAQEFEGAGAFTSSLLKALQDLDTITLTSMTYADLMRRLVPLPKQRPQWEGNGERILFNNSVRDMKAYYPAKFDGKTMSIEVGRVHGIPDDAIFDIWDAIDKVHEKSLTKVKATKVSPFKTEASPPANATLASRTLWAKAENSQKPTLRLYLPESDVSSFTSLYESNRLDGSWVYNLELKELADVGLRLAGGTASFELLAAEEAKHKIPPRSVDAGSLLPIMSNIAFYYDHLRHFNVLKPSITTPKTQNSRPFMSMFDVEVYLLEDDSRTGENLNKGSGVHLMVDSKDPENLPHYGFEITNTSGFNVYPYLFYFNSYDFSIKAFYKPVANSNQKADPPLKAGKSLTVGWGASGVQPQSFSIDEGTDVENGFLKLYITQEYVDMSFLEQKPINLDATRGSHTVQRIPRANTLWGTSMIPFVLERQVEPLAVEPLEVDMKALICVLGTGSAKAQFLQDLSMLDLSTSTRNNVVEYHVPPEDGLSLSILGLPGFENDNLTDNIDLCNDLLSYFRKQESNYCQALILAYDISKPRMHPVDLLNLGLVRDLCGEAFFKNITILTTNWDRGSNDAFKKRESDLSTSVPASKAIIDGGAQMVQYGPSTAAALPDFFANLLDRHEEDWATSSLAVQIEAREGNSLYQTRMGSTLRSRLLDKIKGLERKLTEVMEELEMDDGTLDLEERQAMEDDKRQYETEKQSLETLLDTLQCPHMLN